MNNNQSPLQRAEYTSSLGTLDHYNGIILGDMTAPQADCEGALAVGGTATFGSNWYGYDVGSAVADSSKDNQYMGTYDNSKGYPSLLLGGDISSETVSTRVHNGVLAMRSSYQETYESSSFQIEASSIRYTADNLVDDFFSDARGSLGRIVSLLAKGGTDTIELSELPLLRTLDHSKYLNETVAPGKKVLIYTVNCSKDASITMGEIDFGSFVDSYDLIVINVPAKKVSFPGGAMLYNGSIVDTSAPRSTAANKILQRIASKVVLNFPNAEEISISWYGIIGSVLAPKATFTGSGGSVNGMLFVEHLHQGGGMELHSFYLSMGRELWELEDPLGSVLIEKCCADSKRHLEGAEFALYEYNEEKQIYQVMLRCGPTGEDGLITIEDLPAGKYMLMETKAPKGYSLPEDVSQRQWKFELIINDKGEIPKLQLIYIENSLARGRASFIKHDGENKEIKLVGAKFSLYQYNDETGKYDILIDDTLVTDSAGKLDIDNLLPGKYRLVETDAPTGYHLPKDFWVDFEVTMSSEGEIEEFELVEVANQKLLTVEIVKRDEEDDTITLEGAEFDLYLYDSETDDYNLVKSGLTSGSDGKLSITDLGPGHYKLVETKAPEGYYLDPEDKNTFFTIEEEEQMLIKIAPIDITNKLLGKVQIYKVDADDNTIMLEGAVFTLYKYNDETDDYEEYRTGLTTGADGGLLIEDLEPGDYKLVETACPHGYVLPDSPEEFFSIVL